MIKLSKRLLEIAKMVKYDKVLDLGTDHAHLAIFLSQLGKDVTASDIRENVIERAKDNILKHGANVKTMVSDGLKDIDENFDTVIIAGMGGHLITEILDKPSHKQYLLSPHKNSYELRKILTSKGYVIEDEKVIFDKKWYEIISFVKGEKKYTDIEMFFGPIILANKTKYKDYFDYLKVKLKGKSKKYIDNIDIN